MGRRMAEGAALLTGHVLPAVGYRQWVLSFSGPLAVRLGYDPPAASHPSPLARPSRAPDLRLSISRRLPAASEGAAPEGSASPRLPFDDAALSADGRLLVRRTDESITRVDVAPSETLEHAAAGHTDAGPRRARARALRGPRGARQRGAPGRARPHRDVEQARGRED